MLEVVSQNTVGAARRFPDQDLAQKVNNGKNGKVTHYLCVLMAALRPHMMWILLNTCHVYAFSVHYW